MIACIFWTLWTITKTSLPAKNATVEKGCFPIYALNRICVLIYPSYVAKTSYIKITSTEDGKNLWMLVLFCANIEDTSVVSSPNETSPVINFRHKFFLGRQVSKAGLLKITNTVIAFLVLRFTQVLGIYTLKHEFEVQSVNCDSK